jgi:hypothetical protein
MEITNKFQHEHIYKSGPRLAEIKHMEFLNDWLRRAEKENWFAACPCSRAEVNLIEYFQCLHQLNKAEEDQTYELQPSTSKMPQRIPEDIFTSSMIVTGTGDHVDAPSSGVNPIFDSLKALSGGINGTSTQPLVSSYISARMGDTSRICSLKTEEKPFQIVIRCWRSEDVNRVNEREKYLHTYATANLQLDADSPVHSLIHQTFTVAVREVTYCLHLQR